MISETDKIRIRELISGKAQPADGFEKHFLRVVREEARPASPREREWVTYWQSTKANEVRPDQAVTKKAKRSAGPKSAKKASLVDLMVLASNLGANIHSAKEAAADSLVAQAIEMTTNRSVESLASDPEALQGALNAAKGKYFELLVQEKLNAGEAVGDLVLTEGYRAELAKSMTQPGWDIAIVDASSSQVVDVVQLKATDSANYIRDALEGYPDIKILSTAEAAGPAGGGSLVLDSGISNADIEKAIGHAIEQQDPEFLEAFVGAFNPLFPLIFIAGTEGYRVAVGKRSVEMAVENASARASHSLTGAAVGAVFHALGFGWLSIVPAVVAAHMGPKGVIESLEGWYARQQEHDRVSKPQRNQEGADRYNERMKHYGSATRITPEDYEKKIAISPTGIPAVDDWLSDLTRGWAVANDPGVKAKIRADNEREFQLAKARQLERLKSAK